MKQTPAIQRLVRPDRRPVQQKVWYKPMPQKIRRRNQPAMLTPAPSNHNPVQKLHISRPWNQRPAQKLHISRPWNQRPAQNLLLVLWQNQPLMLPMRCPVPMLPVHQKPQRNWQNSRLKKARPMRWPVKERLISQKLMRLSVKQTPVTQPAQQPDQRMMRQKV